MSQTTGDTPAPQYLPRYIQSRVMDWSVEPDGIFLTLAAGYAFEPSDNYQVACHCRMVTTVQEAIEEIKFAQPCPCERCKNGWTS